MATYTAIPDTEISDDKPILTATGRRLRDNPIAISEGDVSAPPVQAAAIRPHVRFQADNSSIEFSGFTSNGGVEILLEYSSPASGGAHDIIIDFSTDGATYYGAVTLRTAGNSERGVIHINVDFEGEEVRWGGHLDDLSEAFTGTGTSTGTVARTTNYVRISGTAAATMEFFAKLSRWRAMT